MSLITSVNFSQLATSFVSNFITEMSETNKKIAMAATAVLALLIVCGVVYRSKFSASKLDNVDQNEKKGEAQVKPKVESKPQPQVYHI